MKVTPISAGKRVLVDDEDYERLLQYCWTYHPSGYAYRNERHNGKIHKVYMHRYILTEGQKDVASGIAKVSDASIMFTTIADKTETVADKIAEVGQLLGTLEKERSNIVDIVQVIAKTSEETAGQAQSVSAATEEQTASSQEIASVSHSLAVMAEDLHKAIRKFKL